MRRRPLLATIATGIGLSGCLSGSGEPVPTSNPMTEKSETRTPVHKSDDGVEATFQVIDSHEPTDDSASAIFDEETVTVTGTMDPSGCNRPRLTAVRYHAADGVIHLAIGEESPYGETATVECGNASYDYRCVLSVSREDPEAVEVVHNYDGKDTRSFTLVRD